MTYEQVRPSRFALPGKKQLYMAEHEIEVLVVDVTETTVERPKKNKNSSPLARKNGTPSSLKWSENRLQEQFSVPRMGFGRVHDFRLFKQSRLVLPATVQLLTEKGYQGIVKLHANSQTPIKKPKGKSLDIAERRSNCDLARRRVIVAHVNRCLKIFRLLAERYRNRRRRFGLRFNLIAGLYNYDLTLQSCQP